MALTKASYAMINGAPINVLDYGAKAVELDPTNDRFKTNLNYYNAATE